MQKWHKIVLLILGLLVFFGAFVRLNLEDLLVDRLNELVKQDKNSQYTYSYDELELNLSEGNLILTNLTLKPRLKLLDSLSQLNLGKEIVLEIELEEFKMTGLGILEFLIHGKVSLASINFKSPLVKLYENTNFKSAKEESQEVITTEKEFFSDIVSSGLTEATIGEIAFQNASLRLFKIVDLDTSLALVADSSSFSIKGFKANSTSLKSSELFYYDSSAIDLRNIKVYSVDEYRIELGRARKTSTKEDIYFQNVVLSPLKDKYSFMEDKEYQSEWFKFRIKNMIVEELDIAAYQKNKHVNSTHFLIDGLSLEIYKDRRLKEKAYAYKPLLGETIKNIELEVSIPNISISNATIDYREMERNTSEPLHVHFSDLNLTISNFTTDSSSLAVDDTLSIKAKGTFMQKGKLELGIDFYIRDNNNSFAINGILEEMKLKELNPILKNSAFIKFNEGDLNFVAFQMQGNNTAIKGTLDIDYEGLNNLKVIRKKDEMAERKAKGKKKKSEKGFISFLASNLAPAAYNSTSKHYKTGEIRYTRNTNKSIVNLLVNGIKSGVLDTFLKDHEGIKTKVKRKKKKLKSKK